MKYTAVVSPSISGLEIRSLPNGVDFRFGPSTLAASQGVTMSNPSYTATIFADGVQVAQKVIPTHWYYSRWRYLASPQAIINTPKQLFDLGLIPPWQALVPGKSAKDPNWPMPGPMVIAPVYQPMGTTGERPDIGTFHEGTGIWLLGGKPDSMLAYDEALNTLPIYRIDERTGRFWDLLLHPKASVYGGNQQAPTTSQDYINPGPAQVSGQPGWEVAHHPEAAAGAFLATEDVYHLETLQATATQIIYWSAFHYYGGEIYATLPEGQTRGMAHSLRTLALVLICTKYYEDKFGPASKPLNSYAYWKQIADNQLAHITKVWMNSPVTQTFRAFPNAATFAPWQQDHLLNGLALLAWKFPEWRPLYQWAFGNLYNRCLHLPAYPGAYRLLLGPKFIVDQILDPSKLTMDQFYPDWPTMIRANLDLSINDPSGQAFNLTKAQAQALIDDPINSGDWMRANFYNMFIARNALALGAWLDQEGIVDLHTPYPQIQAIHAQQTAYAKKVWSTDVNQFQPNRQAAFAPVVLSPPSTTPPPTTELPMPVDLTPLNAAADALVALVPQVQSAVDNLEAQIVALQAASASGTVDPAAIAAIVTKLTSVKTGLAAAVTDAATPD